jgi:hypothetical protein
VQLQCCHCAQKGPRGCFELSYLFAVCLCCSCAQAAVHFPSATLEHLRDDFSRSSRSSRSSRGRGGLRLGHRVVGTVEILEVGLCVCCFHLGILSFFLLICCRSCPTSSPELRARFKQFLEFFPIERVQLKCINVFRDPCVCKSHEQR